MTEVSARDGVDGGSTKMSVADALGLPALQRGLPEVLCGDAQLVRAIRWVHAGEVPNIASLLRGGELLLTTGMGVGESPEERRRFIEELVDRGVAALMIELGSRFEAIPQEMRDAAESAGLPFVVLHREVPFVEVTEAIHTELVARQYGLLRDGEAVKDRLISIMLCGDGLTELLSAVDEAVGNPVFLESPGRELLFHTDDLDAWEATRHRRDAPRVQEPVAMGPGAGSGRLMMLPTRREPTELDRVILRHAAGIVALTLLRTRQEEELLVRERGNLLEDISAEALGSREAARRAETMGFSPRSRRLLACAIAEAPARTGPVLAAVVGDLRRELEGRAIPVLVGGGGHGPLLALAAPPAHDDFSGIAGELAELIAAIWRRRQLRGRVVTAIDGPVDWDGAGRALANAAQTALAARVLPERPWHDARRLGLERLLWSVREQAELGRYVGELLAPLLAHDRAHAAGLLPTLRALCEHGGRRAETARELHLNRQALYHRIARLERLLGVDLGDAPTLTALAVALRALPFVAASD